MISILRIASFILGSFVTFGALSACRGAARIDRLSDDFNSIEMDHPLALVFLRTGQITEARYFELCRERGWPMDRIPTTPSGRRAP
jgi:hypothetical protein